jgi:hypothetical protein
MTQIHFEKEGKRPSLREATDAAARMARFLMCQGLGTQSSRSAGKPYPEVVLRATELAVNCIGFPVAESRFRKFIATGEDEYIREALEFFRRRAKNLIGLRKIVFRLGDVVGIPSSSVPLDYDSLLAYGITCCEEFDRLREMGWRFVTDTGFGIVQCLDWLRTKKTKKDKKDLKDKKDRMTNHSK